MLWDDGYRIDEPTAALSQGCYDWSLRMFSGEWTHGLWRKTPEALAVIGESPRTNRVCRPEKWGRKTGNYKRCYSPCRANAGLRFSSMQVRFDAVRSIEPTWLYRVRETGGHVNPDSRDLHMGARGLVGATAARDRVPLAAELP